MKSEVNDRKVMKKSPNTWKLNSTFLNNPWAKEEVSREKKIFFNLSKTDQKREREREDTTNMRNERGNSTAELTDLKTVRILLTALYT